MKKLSYLLICLLLVLCLAGCKGKNDVNDNAVPTEDVQPTPEPTAIPEPTATPEPTPTNVPTPTETPLEAISTTSLKDMFAERNMKVGTCLTTAMINDKVVGPMLLSQFSSVTMENALKPDSTFNKEESIASGEIAIKFPKDAITMLDWAKANGIGVRGHTIVWYSQTPDWIFYEDFDKSKGFASREVMLARLESAMKNTFGLIEELGYSDVFYAYDVVNEYWMEDGHMRDNNWTKTIGDDYVWYAFYYARKYAPKNIDLYINDYNEQFKYTSVVKFLNTLVDDEGNYLMDGIGLQAHLYTNDDLDTYFRCIDKLSETGLKLQITELDVCLGAYQKVDPGTDANFKKQGRWYYNLFNGLFERIDAGTLKMDSVTFWGVTDKASWRSKQNPLLFDKRSYPKYAYYGVLQMKDKAGFEE